MEDVRPLQRPLQRPASGDVTGPLPPRVVVCPTGPRRVVSTPPPRLGGPSDEVRRESAPRAEAVTEALGRVADVSVGSHAPTGRRVVTPVK